MRSLCLLFLAACGTPDPQPTADSGTSEPVYADEILHNGGFEMLDASGFPAGWSYMTIFPDEGTVAAVPDSRWGNYALDFALRTDGREFWTIQDDIPPTKIQAGHVYELTGWYRTDHVGDLAFNYIVRGQPGDTPDISTVSQLPVGPTEPDIWQHFSYDIAIPFDASPDHYQFWLHSIRSGGVDGHLTIDGVSLHPKP